MPLCHNCVDPHLRLHQKRDSRGQLVPVRECLASAQESLTTLLSPFQDYIRQRSALTEDRVDSLTKSLVKAREKILEEVGRQFDAYMATTI